MKLPIRTAKELWHLGSLDISSKFERGPSYEGNLLSVSACPNAWQRIAKLGGKPIYACKDDIKLLDMHASVFSKSSAAKSIRKEVSEWSKAAGLMEMKTVFTVSHFDDELDAKLISSYLSREEAEIEAPDPDDITESVLLIGTPKLLEMHGFRRNDIIDIEFAVIEWARHKANHIVSGVYWDEKYDPFCLSAPRGAIFVRTEINFFRESSMPVDDETLLGISSVRWIDDPVSALDKSIQENHK